LRNSRFTILERAFLTGIVETKEALSNNETAKTQSYSLDKGGTMKSSVLLFLLLLILAAGFLAAQPSGGKMILKTTAFQQSQSIPEKYTCDGANISPELTWEGAPSGTKSFALICDDPDAPVGTFTHWVLYDLAADMTSLPENVAKKDQIDSPKAKQGKNDFGESGYGGPCPPRGSRHRYFFKLYALDSEIQVGPGAKKRDVEAAMKGHVLGHAELMGTYQRK
jgi:Raf kinase inhibitor-like YbhB/YbcL family protein